MALPLGYNVRNVRVRWKVSLLAILGMTLVVAVFVTLVAMANGFVLTLGGTGVPGNAIVTQRGSLSELSSQIPQEQLDFVAVDSRVARDSNGTPLASPEMFVVVNLPQKTTGALTNVILRGVSPMAFQVRSIVRLEAGRPFTPGLNEIIVGKGIQARIAGLDMGSTVRIQKRDWKVVGVFGAQQSAFESEVWMESTVLAQAFNRREIYQSLTVRLQHVEDLEGFAAALKGDPKLQLEMKDERAYYAEQAGDVGTRLLALALFVSAVLGIGAVFAGMNTMYAIVAARTREIGTLRALGFSRGSILFGFLIESVFLALAGGLLGCLLALPANFFTGATSSQFTEIAFAFRTSPRVLGAGLALAFVMGVLGGLLPAFRAARLPVAAALKEA
jgi:putative ABC transport system permease protein